MFSILILLITSTVAFTPVWIGPQFRSSTFQNATDNQKISSICGRNTDISYFPWAVSIMYKGKNRLGASIISPYHILTVAHGFVKISGDTTGRNDLCSRAVYRTIEELQSTRSVVYGGRCIRGNDTRLPNHPLCPYPDVMNNKIRSVLVDGDFVNGGCSRGHDWAIIELENKIEFSDRISPICLPPWDVTLREILHVVGWGRNTMYQEADPLVHQVPMRVDSFCQRPTKDLLPVDSVEMICATSLDPTDYSVPRICHGDSGSGMEQRDVGGRTSLVGITSFGTVGCPPDELARVGFRFNTVSTSSLDGINLAENVGLYYFISATSVVAQPVAKAVREVITT